MCPASLAGVLSAHTHELSSGGVEIEWAVNQALEELPAAQATELRRRMNAIPGSHGSLPQPENAILWLREHAVEDADEILKRARSYYHAAQANPEIISRQAES